MPWTDVKGAGAGRKVGGGVGASKGGTSKKNRFSREQKTCPMAARFMGERKFGRGRKFRIRAVRGGPRTCKGKARSSLGNGRGKISTFHGEIRAAIRGALIQSGGSHAFGNLPKGKGSNHWGKIVRNQSAGKKI